MDVFNLRNNLIEDYAAYIKSFIKIQDERISAKVQSEMSQGVLWLAVPKTVKEPSPTFDLKSPTTPVKKKKPKLASLSGQPALVSDFTLPQGNRSRCLKRIMALGQPKNSAELDELAAALGDEDGSIRWLAGSSLVRLREHAVVNMLAAFLETNPGDLAQEEALKVLSLIADADEDEAVREAARRVLQ